MRDRESLGLESSANAMEAAATGVWGPGDNNVCGFCGGLYLGKFCAVCGDLERRIEIERDIQHIEER